MRNIYEESTINFWICRRETEYLRLSCLWRRSRRRMDFRIDELNQGLSLGLIVTVFTGMYFFASSIYLFENLELM